MAKGCNLYNLSLIPLIYFSSMELLLYLMCGSQSLSKMSDNLCNCEKEHNKNHAR